LSTAAAFSNPFARFNQLIIGVGFAWGRYAADVTSATVARTPAVDERGVSVELAAAALRTCAGFRGYWWTVQYQFVILAVAAVQCLLQSRHNLLAVRRAMQVQAPGSTRKAPGAEVGAGSGGSAPLSLAAAATSTSDGPGRGKFVNVEEVGVATSEGEACAAPRDDGYVRRRVAHWDHEVATKGGKGSIEGEQRTVDTDEVEFRMLNRS